MNIRAHIAIMVMAGSIAAAAGSLASAAETLGNPASFDCATATNLAQTIICASPELSDLDRKFEAAAAKAGKKPAAAARKDLIKTRDACSSIACIAKAYKTATAALTGAPATPAKPKATDTAASDAPAAADSTAAAAPAASASEPAKKPDESARKQIEEAQKAAEDAKAAQADAESKLAALQADIDGAKAKAQQDANAKLTTVATRWTKFLTRIIALEGDGYGVMTVEGGNQGFCYATGTEGRSYQNLIGIGQAKDLRGAFMASLVQSMPDQFAKTGDAVRLESVSALVEAAPKSCAAVFGRASDLRAVMAGLDKAGTGYALVPLWFDAAEFKSYAEKAQTDAAAGG